MATAPVACPVGEIFAKPYHASYSSVTLADPNQAVAITFDVEASGQATHRGPSGTKERGALVELGVVATTLSNPPTVLALFEGFMPVTDGRVWEASCIKEFWETSEELRTKKALIDACTSTPEETMGAFVEWMLNIQSKFAGGDARRVVLHTDNPSFDNKWIDLYLDEYTEHPHSLNMFFGHYAAPIDTGSYAMALAGDTGAARVATTKAGRWYSEDDAARRKLQITDKPEAEHNHRAVNDALYIIQMHTILVEAARVQGQARAQAQERTA